MMHSCHLHTDTHYILYREYRMCEGLILACPQFLIKPCSASVADFVTLYWKCVWYKLPLLGKRRQWPQSRDSWSCYDLLLSLSLSYRLLVLFTESLNEFPIMEVEASNYVEKLQQIRVQYRHVSCAQLLWMWKGCTSMSWGYWSLLFCTTYSYSDDYNVYFYVVVLLLYMHSYA